MKRDEDEREFGLSYILFIASRTRPRDVISNGILWGKGPQSKCRSLTPFDGGNQEGNDWTVVHHNVCLKNPNSFYLNNVPTKVIRPAKCVYPLDLTSDPSRNRGPVRVSEGNITVQPTEANSTLLWQKDNTLAALELRRSGGEHIYQDTNVFHPTNNYLEGRSGEDVGCWLSVHSSRITLSCSKSIFTF